VLLFPNLDATTSKPSWRELGTGAYTVSHAQMMDWYNAYLPQGINREDPKVSPLFATDLTGVAPAGSLLRIMIRCMTREMGTRLS
jgi:acetyl esterase